MLERLDPDKENLAPANILVQKAMAKELTDREYQLASSRLCEFRQQLSALEKEVDEIERELLKLNSINEKIGEHAQDIRTKLESLWSSTILTPFVLVLRQQVLKHYQLCMQVAHLKVSISHLERALSIHLYGQIK